MSESTELARQVASQLGGDLDRILGSLPDSDAFEKSTDTPKPKQDEATTARPLELRQIAGRGSGQRFLLKPGTYDVGPRTSPPGMPGSCDPHMTPFRLKVDENLLVTLIILDRAITVDGRRVGDGLRMRGGVIDAHSARFEIGEPVASILQKPPTRSQIIEALPSSEIPIREIRGASVDGKGRRRSNKRGVTPADFPDLTKAVLTARARTIRRERMLYPSINELLARAKIGRSHIWNLERNDTRFGVATLAYGEMPWTPPYDRPDKVTDEAAYAVSQFLETPSMPIVKDLKSGGLGIIGPREATMAAVRHIVISQSTLSSPGDIEFAIMADPVVQTEWSWSQRLPHTHHGDGRAIPVLIVDGLSQMGANDLRAILAGEATVGVIVIEPELGDLPSICSTVMEIRRDGSAALMDFRIGTTINSAATPVGLSDELAAEASADIERAALGQSGPAARPLSGLPKRGSTSQKKIAIPDHISRPKSPAALPQRRGKANS